MILVVTLMPSVILLISCKIGTNGSPVKAVMTHDDFAARMSHRSAGPLETSLHFNSTIEMAAMIERVSDAAEPLPPAPRRCRPVFGAVPSLRKSMSAPNLPSIDGPGMEVYVSLFILSGPWILACMLIVRRAHSRS